MTIDLADFMPEDAAQATLLGRASSANDERPLVCTIRDGEPVALDVPTMAHLLAEPDPLAFVRAASGRALDITSILAPFDLQPVKAAGVTFVDSLLERVIEESTRGDATASKEARTRIQTAIGGDLAKVKPGSPEAAELKETLIELGHWSQYLEVGIGQHAEIFSKASPLSSIGTGGAIGIREDSVWSNPEPEVVLALAPSGRILGASLGNDVNLRDWEGRSALLLGRAKDSRAACAIGPFIRLFDERFNLDILRNEDVLLEVTGEDDFQLKAISSMSRISRDPIDLAAQAFDGHDWPDGLALFLGTMFAPTTDRDTPGGGFTHHTGDTVRISSEHLGTLLNHVRPTADCPPWTQGLRSLLDSTS